MDIKGRLIKKLPAMTGQGRNGEWKKQDFVIEIEGTYPRFACFSVWNDKLKVDSLTEGSTLNVFFDIESREFQGKWFTNLTAWKADSADDATHHAQPLPPIESYRPDMDGAPEDDMSPF